MRRVAVALLLLVGTAGPVAGQTALPVITGGGGGGGGVTALTCAAANFFSAVTAAGVFTCSAPTGVAGSGTVGTMTQFITNATTVGNSAPAWTTNGTSWTLASGQLLLPGGSEGAPMLASSAAPTTGFLIRNAGILDMAISGLAQWEWDGSGHIYLTSSTYMFGWSSTRATLTGADTAIGRNAAGVVEVNNATLGTFRDVVSRSHFLGSVPATPLASSLFLGSVAFASLATPTNGTVAFCNDCDAPTLVDSTCTSAGAKTGSLAVRVNGAWKCIS